MIRRALPVLLAALVPVAASAAGTFTVTVKTRPLPKPKSGERVDTRGTVGITRTDTVDHIPNPDDPVPGNSPYRVCVTALSGQIGATVAVDADPTERYEWALRARAGDGGACVEFEAEVRETLAVNLQSIDRNDSSYLLSVEAPRVR